MKRMPYEEYIARLDPGMILYMPAAAPVLTSAEQVDQAAAFKELFGGRWPHAG